MRMPRFGPAPALAAGLAALAPLVALVAPEPPRAALGARFDAALEVAPLPAGPPTPLGESLRRALNPAQSDWERVYAKLIVRNLTGRPLHVLRDVERVVVGLGGQRVRYMDWDSLSSTGSSVTPGAPPPAPASDRVEPFGTLVRPIDLFGFTVAADAAPGRYRARVLVGATDGSGPVSTNAVEFELTAAQLAAVPGRGW